MKTAKTLTLALLTIALAAAGCGTGTGSDSDSDSGTGGGGSDTDHGSGGGGTDTDSGTGGGGTDTDGGTGGHAGSDSGTGGHAGSDGGDGSGGAISTGGTLPTGIEFEYDPSLDLEPETCADVQIDSEEIFLDIFLVLDRSMSMGDDCDVGDTDTSKWCNSVNAVYGFFSDPSTVGTGFAYGGMPLDPDECGAEPLAVEFGLIEAGDANGKLQDLEDALNDHGPDGWTPTEGAIATIIAETSAHEPEGTRRTIGILITDGDPYSNCEDDVPDLATMLNDHFDNTGIPTYVIGMTGATANNLETLAVGSGAEPHSDYCDASHTSCSYYTVGDGNPAAFIAALDSIRSSVLGCEYVVPASQVGLADLDTLDVQFTPASGETALGLTRVADEASCAGSSEFFVDLSGADPIVKLCPATCDLRGEGASIDIQLLCEGS